jgi:hypothetical protein
VLEAARQADDAILPGDFLEKSFRSGVDARPPESV